jgi:mannose-1-phosphate guanylyltransferase
MYYAVIMAGGSGTRLWPLSRRNRPKQALQLVGERTMFQHAVERLSPLFSPAQIVVVTKADHVKLLASQTPDLPLDNFLVEPEGRGTAPAIGLAALHLRRRDPAAVMVVLTADHFIADTEGFRKTLAAAAQVAQTGHLVTLGIKPSSPSTGFGYIQQAESLGSEAGFPVFRVKQFSEKPNQADATRMVASGDHSWNSGMFIWRIDRILEEFRRQMPEFYAQLSELETALETDNYPETISRLWPNVAEQTIDYGIMEGAQDVAVIPVDIGWSDVGSWTSLFELLPIDAAGNILTGSHVAIDTHSTLVLGGEKRLIATIGVEDLVIVDTEDALLICTKEREQDVRAVVKQLKQEGRTTWL